MAALISPLSAYAGPKVASMYCSGDSAAQSDVQKKLQDTKLFDKVDNVDMGASAPALTTLQQYDAVLVWADTSRSCSDPTNTGNVLAQYVESGGGVVTMLPYYVGYTSSNVSGEFYSKYALVTQGSMSYLSGLTLGTKSEMHPVLEGVSAVSTIRSGYHRASFNSSSLRNGGRIIATWSDGNGMVVVGTPNGKNRVDLNIYMPTGDVSSGSLDPKSDGMKLVSQSLIWVSNPLRATPSSLDFGDVPAGTTSLPQNVDVRNTGKDPLTISGASLSVTGEYEIKVLGGVTFPTILNMGDKLSFEVSVRPTAPGKRQASINVNVSTPGASGLVIPLSANGLGPVIKTTPNQINYGGMPSGAMPRSVNVTVMNAGGGLLYLRGAPTLSDNTNFSIVSPPMTPVNLAAGASVNFDVKFNPVAEGRYSATLTIPYNDGTDKNQTIAITGSFGKPKISVPGSIVMSPVRVSQLGPAQSIVVTNSGLADLTISAVDFTGRDPADFKALTVPTMMTPIVVTSGSSTELRVQCNPTVQGLRQATFNITSDDPMLGVATVALTCSGVVANFDISPAKIDFTTPQQTGQCAAPQTVTVKNSGTDSLRVLSVSFSGPNAASFQQPVMGAKIVPGMNGTLLIPVSFCPVDIGAQTADLVVMTDLTAGHVAKVPLTGTGTGPKVVVTPPAVDFGPIYINTTSAPVKISLANDGDQPLTFGKNALTPPMGAFKVMGLPPDGTKLNKGDPPIILSITASPLQAMQQSGELSILVNDLVKGGNLKIPLAVLGTQAEISVMPMTLSFPLTIIGTTSNPQMITVTNTGAAPLTGIDVVIAGANAPDFVPPPSNMLPSSVATGSNFSFPVAFRPTAAKTLNAIVVVKASGLMAPVQVKVDGQGKLLAITCSPDSKNFGNTPVGTTKPDKVTCRNSDTAPIDYVASVTDFPDDWTIEPTEGQIAAATGGDEGLQTLNLTFHPSATGPRTTTLTIKTKDGLTVGSVNLDGNGTTPPKEKETMDVGCAYGGRTGAPPAFLLMFLALGGLALLRRLRYS